MVSISRVSRIKTSKDLTYQTIGRWGVIGVSEKRSSSGGLLWDCVCSCGTERSVRATHLLRDKSKSCGCLRTEKAFAQRGCKKYSRNINKPVKVDIHNTPKVYALSKANTTGYRGVNFRKSSRTYIAHIMYNSKIYFLWSHSTALLAYGIRKEAEEAITNGTFMEWYLEGKKERGRNTMNREVQ